MAITPCIEYDWSISEISGNATLPGHSGPATHGLVFMLGGLSSRWKQVVAYFLTGNKTDGSCFRSIILAIIEKAAAIGLHVCAVTSDMGAPNRAMWATFGVTTNRQFNITSIAHPINPEKNLYFLADVPHIIKNLKSAFINGLAIYLTERVCRENKLTSNIVNLEAVKDLMEFQKDSDLKLAPSLKESMLKPSHFDKMKVSNALHFFSHSVSSAIRYMVQTNGRNSDYLTTAYFIEQCNRWFDLMSSRHSVLALSRKDPERYQAAIDFLQSFVSLFKEIKIGEKECGSLSKRESS